MKPLSRQPKDPTEGLVETYLHNLLAGTDLVRGPLNIRRIEDNAVVKRLAARGAGESEQRMWRAESEEYEGDRLRRKLKAYLVKEGRAPHRPPKAGGAFAANLDTLSGLLGLSPAQRAVLTFLCVQQHRADLRDFLEAFGDQSLTTGSKLLALALSLPPARVQSALDAKGALVASGIVAVRDGSYALPTKFDLKEGILDLVSGPKLTRDKVLARFLCPAEPSSLSRDDFKHLQDEVDLTRALLRGALARNERGVNVLFHGATGTGKTQLARLLAQELSCPLFSVGLGDDDGESASAHERLSSLLLAHRLLGKSPSLLLFDELEDLFHWEPLGPWGGGRTQAQMSKQWFNDALEKNPAPTIWITNETDGIDPAFLRRFQYAVEFTPLGARQRARVLARHLGGTSRLAPDDIDLVAQRFVGSPAQFASAVTAASLVCSEGRPDRATLERVLAPIEKLVTGADPHSRPVFDRSRYRISALNCSEDPDRIAARLQDWKPSAGPGISLCLYGPPGTGKSEFVKYLAAKMGRRIVYRRSSDIESCWVGETQKNIARAFREAESDEAVLLFDEVDSFLRDRRGAVRSWEVSAVNEFLQQLECFRGVVACTTNLWKDIDAAALRRFVIKVEFGYARPEQALALFQATLSPFLPRPLSAEEEAELAVRLARLPQLAPGDFAAVARRTAALGERPNAGELLRLLEGEVRAKGAPTRPAGFGTDR